MYAIALIQNQSEMSHYGYADARPMLTEFGYKSVLYTAQNIDDLVSDLEHFDAVLFASNSLNDKTIRSVLLSDDLRTSFDNFLGRGGGCLVLHQLRMAQENMPLSFLPSPLSAVAPRDRKTPEKATDGEFILSSVGRDHITFLYPHTVDISETKSHCLSFRSLRGLYWHYWDKVPHAHWDILLFDKGPGDIQRPLIVNSKASEPFRVTLCSLPIDWQRQRRLFQNILTYVVEGEHRTAILKDSRKSHAGFDYFVEYLRSLKYPFRIYHCDVSQNVQDVKHNIKSRVHSIVIFGPFVGDDRFEKDTVNFVNEYVDRGEIKLIKITQREFNIAGRERYALRLLYELEPKVQQEISKGYIDGSFWSTVESLQVLNQLSKYVRSKYDQSSLKEVLEATKTHDRNGSYDEVFGVTCALLWLRATYLGTKHEDTMRTLKYLRENLAEYEHRERVLAYFTFIETGLATDEERAALNELLLTLQMTLDHFSEIDSIVYLRAGIASICKDIIVPLITHLDTIQNSGCWIDLATTATAVTTLHQALDFLKREDVEGYVRIQERLESMIFTSINYIQNSMEKPTTARHPMYPWDNKASTSLKCIYGWLQFEKLIDLPVHELVDALRSYVHIEAIKSSAKSTLTILEELKSDNKNLTSQIANLKEVEQRADKDSRIYRILWCVVCGIGYLNVSVLVYGYRIGFGRPAEQVFKGTFTEGWVFHFAVLGLLISTVAIGPAIAKWWKRKKKLSE